MNDSPAPEPFRDAVRRLAPVVFNLDEVRRAADVPDRDGLFVAVGGRLYSADDERRESPLWIRGTWRMWTAEHLLTESEREHLPHLFTPDSPWDAAAQHKMKQESGEFLDRRWTQWEERVRTVGEHATIRSITAQFLLDIGDQEHSRDESECNAD